MQKYAFKYKYNILLNLEPKKEIKQAWFQSTHFENCYVNKTNSKERMNWHRSALDSPPYNRGLRSRMPFPGSRIFPIPSIEKHPHILKQ